MCSSQYLYEFILSQILLCALHGLYFINLPQKSFQTCLPLGLLYSKLSKYIELCFCEMAPCLLIALILWEIDVVVRTRYYLFPERDLSASPLPQTCARFITLFPNRIAEGDCRAPLAQSALLWGAEPLLGWRLLHHQGFQNNKVHRTETLYLLESLWPNSWQKLFKGGRICLSSQLQCCLSRQSRTAHRMAGGTQRERGTGRH